MFVEHPACDITVRPQSGTPISHLADTSFTREEAATNGQQFAAECGCWDGEGKWDPDTVEQCLR